MGHYYAEMRGEVEPREEVLVGFVVTSNYRVMTVAKARSDLKFLHYISATRHPTERDAKAFARAGMQAEVNNLEARIVELKRRLRSLGARNGRHQ